jgi:uncharacterized membrane protein YdbT with pleckstrin-like domain
MNPGHADVFLFSRACTTRVSWECTRASRRPVVKKNNIKTPRQPLKSLPVIAMSLYTHKPHEDEFESQQSTAASTTATVRASAMTIIMSALITGGTFAVGQSWNVVITEAVYTCIRRATHCKTSEAQWQAGMPSKVLAAIALTLVLIILIEVSKKAIGQRAPKL